jgi:predicted enzyme related to lactoylglutathione lyase
MTIRTSAVLAALIVGVSSVCSIRAEDAQPAPGANAPAGKPEQAPIKRVTGIGGIFIKAKDPVKLRAWYKAHLGIDVKAWGGTSFSWVDAAGAPVKGKTAWMVGDGSDFAPSNSSFMINYRVADLRGLLKLLRDEGCQVLDKVEQSDFGIFGWVMDPEGNKVELWQPPEGH